MFCPACHRRLEKKRILSLDLDRCTACDGLWFDRGEAVAFVERLLAARPEYGKPGAAEKLAAAAEDVGERGDEPESLDCPRCGGGDRLAGFFYLNTGKAGQRLFLHRCVDCGGVWADKHEVGLLTALYAEKPLPSKLGGK